MGNRAIINGRINVAICPHCILPRGEEEEGESSERSFCSHNSWDFSFVYFHEHGVVVRAKFCAIRICRNRTADKFERGVCEQARAAILLLGAVRDRLLSIYQHRDRNRVQQAGESRVSSQSTRRRTRLWPNLRHETDRMREGGSRSKIPRSNRWDWTRRLFPRSADILRFHGADLKTGSGGRHYLGILGMGHITVSTKIEDPFPIPL